MQNQSKLNRGRGRTSRRAVNNNRAQPKRSARNPMSDSLSQAKRDAVAMLASTEVVAPVPVPANSRRGDLLYAVEVNPRKLGPTLAAMATQAESWAGNFEFLLAVNGDALAKNYAIARWLPDGRLSKLPAGGDALWRLARGNPRARTTDKAKLKYNIIAGQETSASVKAPWLQTYNPRKPVEDEDPSDRNLGVFIIVSNGPPGQDITIDVDVTYEVYLMGGIPTKVIVDTSTRINNPSPPSFSAPFIPAPDVQSDYKFEFTSNSYEPPDGTYLVHHRFVGTGITALPAISVVGGTFSIISSNFQSTSGSIIYTLDATDGPTIVSLGPIAATTFTLHNMRLAPYSRT